MAGIEALKVTFFEECEDLLARMGEGLSEMQTNGEATEIETLHSVFRAAHSIKGGAGAFGLTALVNFTHVFETVLDLMRAGRLGVNAKAMHTLMRAYDVLCDLVGAARDGGPEPAQMGTLLLELDALADGGGAEEAEEIDFEPVMLDLSLAFDAEPPAEAASGGFSITIAPSAELYAAGHEPAALLRALAQFGEMRTEIDFDAVPPLAAFDFGASGLRWHVELATAAPIEEVEAVFDFVGDHAGFSIRPIAPPAPAVTAPAAPAVTAPPGPAATVHETPAATPAPDPTVPAPAAESQEARPQRATGEASVSALPMSATIRVNLDRVDRLINQIGELVIMEAMLSQAIANASIRDNGDISTSLEGIKQLATAIQESVMSIRAQPLKPVFQRMQRITREASDATGKQVRLQTFGENTEVDKTVIERLVDPLTHMIRNSVDHGIETADKRRAAGKPAEGVITLSAAHRSGRVIIEVSDDGAGIDRVRVREIAEARGLIAPGAQLSASDIDNLLFLPGFSSKSEVSALSGRGVGLDVVRREIQSLGGRVTIQSVPGKGTTFTIALPLTLAVLEGMLIGVGSETMVLPLSCIIETMRPSASQIHVLGRNERLIASRGALIPIIDVAEWFGFAPIEKLDRTVLILVEYDSGRTAALAVDRIHDQRQVVIKSLEDNYGSVPGVSAATILGDGRIALIIDPEEIIPRAVTETMTPLNAAIG